MDRLEPMQEPSDNDCMSYFSTFAMDTLSRSRMPSGQDTTDMTRLWNEALAHAEATDLSNDSHAAQIATGNPTRRHESIDSANRALVSQQVIGIPTPNPIHWTTGGAVTNFEGIPSSGTPFSSDLELVGVRPSGPSSNSVLVGSMVTMSSASLNSIGVPAANHPHPFICRWRNCGYTGSFGREAELRRHIREIHVAPGSFRCPIRGCGKRCNRRNNLQEHMRRVHPSQ